MRLLLIKNLDRNPTGQIKPFSEGERHVNHREIKKTGETMTEKERY